MKIINELLDYSKTHNEENITIFTANGVLDKSESLIMGGGNALAARLAFPQAPKLIGQELKDNYTPDKGVYTFGVLTLDGIPWAFQSKLHWKDNSPLSIIEMSAKMLDMYAKAEKNITFHLPFPGISLGGLKREVVLPLIQNLPDNVLVYEV